MDKLYDDFYLLTRLNIICNNLPPPSYSYYTKLDMWSREVMDYTCPIGGEWRSINKYEISCPYMDQDSVPDSINP